MVSSGSSMAFAIMAAMSMVNVVSSKAGQSLQVRQQQAAGTPLFLNEPACDYYQCDIIWYPGQNVSANWLDPPSGNVVLDMMTDAGATFAYNIATVPGTTNNCDVTGGTTCGAFAWIVPSAWLNGTTYGNYSLRASSQNDPTIQSYTDIILVKPQNGTTTSSVAFQALDPTAGSSSNSASSSVSATSAPAGTAASSSGQSVQSVTSTSTSGSSSKSGTNSAPSLINPTTQAVAAITVASIFAGIAFVL